MKIISWANSKIRKFNHVDIQLIKLSVFGFTLFLAKVWSPLLSLEWYWYLLIFVLPALILFFKIFKK